MQPPAPALPSRSLASGFSHSGWRRLLPAGVIMLGLALALAVAESVGARPVPALALQLEATCPGSWSVQGGRDPISGTLDAAGRWQGTVPEGASLQIAFTPRVATAAVAIHWRLSQGRASRDDVVWGTSAQLIATAHEGDHD